MLCNNSLIAEQRCNTWQESSEVRKQLIPGQTNFLHNGKLFGSDAPEIAELKCTHFQEAVAYIMLTAHGRSHIYSEVLLHLWLHLAILLLRFLSSMWFYDDWQTTVWCVTATNWLECGPEWRSNKLIKTTKQKQYMVSYKWLCFRNWNKPYYFYIPQIESVVLFLLDNFENTTEHILWFYLLHNEYISLFDVFL